MDQRTRKFMLKALLPRDDIDRLYELRKGRRGLTNIEDSVDASKWRLEKDLKEQSKSKFGGQ